MTTSVSAGVTTGTVTVEPSLKFCGLTRGADARYAADLGAAYVGCIFAGGPRLVTAEQAREVAGAARGAGSAAVRVVGVMGDLDARAIAVLAERAALDIVQLHADPTASAVAAVRRHWNGAVWAVVRIRGSDLPAHAGELFDVADAVVLDARVDGGPLGGTGVSLPWRALAGALAPYRGGAPIILAGGLRPENVARAVAELAPNVVDVSSGVECAPGLKDHARMAAFAAALRPLVAT